MNHFIERSLSLITPVPSGPEAPLPNVVGFSVTVTFPGGIVPLGKPWPVTSTPVTNGSAVVGEAEGLRVTLVVACNTTTERSAKMDVLQKQARYLIAQEESSR